MRNEDYGELSHKLKEAANWTCAVCGYHASSPAEHVNILVHHRDGNDTNDSDDNLIVLCDGCHDKITWFNKDVRE